MMQAISWLGSQGLLEESNTEPDMRGSVAIDPVLASGTTVTSDNQVDSGHTV